MGHVDDNEVQEYTNAAKLLSGQKPFSTEDIIFVAERVLHQVRKEHLISDLERRQLLDRSIHG